MSGMTKRVAERIASALKSLRPVIEQQRSRDVSEADTVTLVKDALSTAFGFDKYAELTSEHAIRGTYCDIAIVVDSKPCCLVEVKAVGTDLEDRHVKQVVDYAANKGIEWCMLTNGREWRLYHIVFAKPIDKRLIVSIMLGTIDLKDEACLDQLFLFTKEGFAKGAQSEARDRLDATSRFLLAALVLENEDILAAIRRELRKVVDVLVSPEEIQAVLRDQVLKRDTLEGPEATAALAKVSRQQRRAAKAESAGQASTDCSDAPAAAPGA